MNIALFILCKTLLLNNKINNSTKTNNLFFIAGNFVNFTDEVKICESVIE